MIFTLIYYEAGVCPENYKQNNNKEKRKCLKIITKYLA